MMQKKIHGQKKVVYIYFGISPCCTHGFAMYSRHCIVSFLFRPNWTELEWTMRIQTTNTNQLQCKQNAWTTPNKLKFANIVRIANVKYRVFFIDFIEKAFGWFWRFRIKIWNFNCPKVQKRCKLFHSMELIWKTAIQKTIPTTMWSKKRENFRCIPCISIRQWFNKSVHRYNMQFQIANLHAHLYDTRLC